MINILDLLKKKEKLISPVSYADENNFVTPVTLGTQISAQVEPQRRPTIQKPFIFDFSKYPSNQGYQPPQPPANIAQIIKREFPNEATKAATVAWAENLGYKPEAINPYNKNKTTDYGLFQNNSGTLEDLQRRKPWLIKKAGINTVKDLFDINKNVKLAKIIKDEGGWKRWLGWQGRGFQNITD